MAATAQARRLTETHRLAQARLGAQTVAQMFTAWRLLDPENLDGTIDRWLRIAVPLVERQRTISAQLAGNYLTTFRALEIGTTGPRFTPVLVPTVAAEAIATSLTVTGPVSMKSAASRGVIITQAEDVARSRAAAAAMRHTLNGGRETVVQTMRADPRALGWARATSGKTCAFCAMLAGRGAVYSEDTADFEAHDHCACSAEPVYREDAALPTGSDRFQAMWQEARQLDGEPVDNFRRLVEAA